MKETYYFGQGRVSIRPKDGDSKAWRWLGDVSELTLNSEAEETLKHKENYSGLKNTVRSIRFGGEYSLTATLFQIDKNNLAMAARGTITDIPAGTVTGEDLGAVAVGDLFILDNGFNVSDVVIKDSASTELEPEHYDLDARTGRIEILSLPGTLVAPFTVAYKYSGASGVVLFNKQIEDFELKYEGINMAENNVPVLLELYKVSPGNLQSLSLISGDTSSLASMPWTADVLADASRPSNSVMGQIGRFLEINQD